jgi:ubiquitin-like protein ATG12
MAEAGPPPGDTASTAAPSAEEGAATAASAPPPPPGGAARPEKIRIQFKAVGSAPILKRNKFQIAATETFFAVDQFLRSQLKLRLQVGSAARAPVRPSRSRVAETATRHAKDSLFIYCKSAFAPSPDQTLGSLFECFGSGGELIIQYSTTEGLWRSLFCHSRAPFRRSHLNFPLSRPSSAASQHGDESTPSKPPVMDTHTN